LYDGGCGLNKASFTVSGTVTGAGYPTFTASGLTQPNGYFAQGVVTFNTGLNAGLSRTVKRHSSGGLITPYTFPHIPQVGDTFSIYPGCDKTTGSQGCAKFSNIAKFRGFPYVPSPETALA
jgi:uncharacterized phage protein (TIGR02218 family)